MRDPMDARLRADGVAFRRGHGSAGSEGWRPRLAPLAAAAAVVAVAAGAVVFAGQPKASNVTPAGTGACAEGFVVFTSGTGNDFIADNELAALHRWTSRDGRLEPRKIVDPVARGGASLSPDGKRLLYATAIDEPPTSSFVGRPELYISDAEGGSPRQLLPDEHWDSDPQWSPDGGMIAFVRRPQGATEGGPSELWVMRADGSEARRLTSGEVDKRPAWSPDGRSLAFIREGDEQQRAMKIGSRLAIYASSSGEVSVPDQGFTAGPGDPAWSPDGSKIAYAYIDYAGGGFSRVAVLNLTSGQTTLTPEKNDSPAWAPAGRLLTRQATLDGFALAERDAPDGPVLREQPFSEPALTFDVTVATCTTSTSPSPSASPSVAAQDPSDVATYRLRYSGPVLIDGGSPDPQAAAVDKIRACLELPGVRDISEGPKLPANYRLAVAGTAAQSAFEACAEGVAGFELVDTRGEKTFIIRPGQVADVRSYASAMTQCLNLPGVGATSFTEGLPQSYVAYAGGPAVDELDRCLQAVPGAGVEVQPGAPGNPVGLQDFIARCVGRENAAPGPDAEYIGLTEEQVNKPALERDGAPRVVGRDRVCLDRNDDRQPNRVNVILDDGRVVWAGRF